MQEEYAIQVENLHKFFDQDHVLKGIDLTIKPGERLCIVGKSGTGKTVLMDHMRADKDRLYPDKGRVLFYRQDFAELSEQELEEIRKKIGVVFQYNALFSAMNVYENIIYAPKQHKLVPENRLEELAKQSIDAVGLGNEYNSLINKKPGELSGGMKKRVAIARAIALNPPIMIYDEPTFGLDPGSVDIINNLITKLHRQDNKTTIVVSHEIKTMRKVGGRMIFLYNGKVYSDCSCIEFEKRTDKPIMEFLGEQKAVDLKKEQLSID